MLDSTFEAPRKRPTGVTAIAVLVAFRGYSGYSLLSSFAL